MTTTTRATTVKTPTSPEPDSQPTAAHTLASLERELHVDLPAKEAEARAAIQIATTREEGERGRDALRDARLRHNHVLLNELPRARHAVSRELREAASAAERALLPQGAALRAAVAEAQAEVTRLETFKRAAPHDLRLAAAAGDADALRDTQAGLDCLANDLFGAQVRLLRLQIAVSDEEVATALAGVPDAQVIVDAKQAVVDQAQAELRDAQRAAALVRGAATKAKTDAADRRRWLDELVAEHGRDPGPVVRSRLHAGSA